VAYTASKGLDLDWCIGCDKGLVQPDAVFFMNASPDTLSARGGYGEERYEKLDFQKKVYEQFLKISEHEKAWKSIEAGEKTIDELEAEIQGIVKGLREEEV